MSRKTTVVTVALVALAVAAFFVFNGRNSSSAGGVTVITQANVEAEVQNTDKPVLLLVTGSNCADCPAVLEALTKESAKYPDVKFAVIDADDVGAPAEVLPAIISVLPKAGQTAAKMKVTAAEVPAYVAKRAAVSSQQMSALKKAIDLQSEIETKGKPFDDQLKDVKARMDAALKPIQEEGKQLQDKITAADPTIPGLFQKLKGAQSEAEFNSIKGEIDQKLAPYKGEIDALNAKMKDTRQKFVDEAKPIAEARSQALGTLEQEFEAAQGEFMQLVLMDQLGLNDAKPEQAPPAPAEKI